MKEKKPVRMAALRRAVTTLRNAGCIKGTPMAFEKTVMMAVEVPSESTMTKRRKDAKHHKMIKKLEDVPVKEMDTFRP